MASIAENIRATILSLKQMSDRLKTLILTSVTKTEANTAKQDIINAIGNIPAPDLSNVAKQGNNPNTNLTIVDAKIDDFYDTFDADMALQLSQIIGTETETEENSQTEEQISGLRTLQESYSVLADHCQTIVVDNTVLSQELEPGNIYMFTNRTNNLSITLATPEEGELAIYHLIIESGEAIPTLSFPVSVYWPGGDPVIGPDERLEINILDNNALYILS